MGRPVSKRKNVTATGRRLPDVPGIKLERHWWEQGAVVVGVDEVGRGAWAGPVTFAAVVLPSNRRMYKLRDSKVLDPQRRQELAARLHTFARSWALGSASQMEIDALGMSAAMRLAARRAVDALDIRPDVALLDGNWDFLTPYPAVTHRVVHGDARSASIAAASIVAKVARDAWMVEWHDAWPEYAFSANKGYPSPPHRQALVEHGPCPLHRRTWAPVVAARAAACVSPDGVGD